MWLFTVATTGALGAGFVLYSLGMLPTHPFWWERSLMAPSSEDYAAYSAFMDDFFSSNQPFRIDQDIGPNNIVLVASETLTSRNPSDPILPNWL